MSASKPYTAAMLRKFDRLTKKMSSPRQMDRIEARLACNAFVKEHGKQVCDAMFTVLLQRDAKRGW